MSAMDSDSKTNNAAHAGRILRLVGFLRSSWDAATHRHEWERTNDADMMDVPDCYPPTHVCYISPRRRCKTCGTAQWYVGPEVCGGDRARWVPMPVDFSKPNS
jgi:hypothetical protein